MNPISRHIFTLIATIFLQTSGLIQWRSRGILGLVRPSWVDYNQWSKNIKPSFWRRGMGILALTADERVVTVVFADDTVSVPLRDGRTITVPLAWYPRLLRA